MDCAQIRHVRRLGSPGAGDGAECDPTQQPDEDDQCEVVPPPLPEGGPEPVGRGAAGARTARPLRLLVGVRSRSHPHRQFPDPAVQCASPNSGHQGG